MLIDYTFKAFPCRLRPINPLFAIPFAYIPNLRKYVVMRECVYRGRVNCIPIKKKGFLSLFRIPKNVTSISTKKPQLFQVKALFADRTGHELCLYPPLFQYIISFQPANSRITPAGHEPFDSK